MNPNAPQGVVRELLSEADHLSRMAHEDHDDALSMRFAALRTELARVERRFGASPPRPTGPGEIDLLYQRIKDVVAAAGSQPAALVDRFARVAERLRAPRAKTLVGMKAVTVSLPYSAPKQR